MSRVVSQSSNPEEQVDVTRWRRPEPDTPGNFFSGGR